MKVSEASYAERMISAARAAASCRAAIWTTTEVETQGALQRAADRYSQLVAHLADEMLNGGER